MTKIIRNNHQLDFKSFHFPAGEVGVKLNLDTTAFVAKTNFFAPSDHQTIIARIQTSNNIMELIMLVDALRRVDNVPIYLFMPYCPYSRQDRVCDKGESFSLKVFGNLINSLNLDQICIVDPHSNVCDAVFNNLKIITQLEIINEWTKFISRINSSKTCFISPDSGSIKKTIELAKYFNHADFVRADKLRDVTNGDIKETIVYYNDLHGHDIICADDLCDGGKTFVELAKVCKSKNCGKFILYVTHGIFSKGLDLLFNNGIDEVWTTDSFYNGNDLRVNVLKLEKHVEI